MENYYLEILNLAILIFLSFIVCRIYGFVGGLTGTASIATLTAISIDRYNVGKELNKKNLQKKFTKKDLQ